MKDAISRITVVVTIFFVGTTGPLVAQMTETGIAPRLPSASAAAYYYIAKPGELTMTVNLWGFVKIPGRYEVPSSTDLVQLLSYAGGPVQFAKLSEVKITRIHRTGGRTTKEEIRVDLERLDHLADAELELRPGDTIFIDHTSWLTIRDAFSVITTAAVITSAIAQMLIASRR